MLARCERTWAGVIRAGTTALGHLPENDDAGRRVLLEAALAITVSLSQHTGAN